ALGFRRGLRVALLLLPAALALRQRGLLLPHRLVGGRNGGIELPPALLVLWPRDGDQRCHLAALLGVDALLVDAVEEGEDLVELLLRNRVVLVVVAAAAAHRQAEDHRRRRLDPIHRVLHAPLLVNRAGLGDGAVVAVEAGGDPLRQRRPQQQVA